MSKKNQEALYSRGAEWRRWDLHIHSDASDGHMSCEQIVQAAIDSDLAVIALTDHHTTKNIDLARSLGYEAGLSVLAGIEFRTEYGSRSVHIIGLFPECYKDYELSGSNLQSLVLDPLNLSEARIIAEGKKRLSKEGRSNVSDTKAFKAGLSCVQVDFKKAADKTHEYGGIVIPHAGSKENSFEREMRHEGKTRVRLFDSLGPVKQQLFDDKYIDICEIAKGFDNEEFYLRKFNRASIVCSDAHNIAEIGRKYTWIKADPTFNGLRQVIREPASRVFTRDRPEVLQRLELNPTKYFEQLAIEPEDGYDGKNGKWFESVRIKLNPELIAIIGNKGSGKSAIADILGLCTSCRRESRFSFLNPKRFRQRGYADAFCARLSWISGDTQESKNLMTNVDLTRPETAKYLPQGYFEELCNDIDSLEQLKMEINEVVFQHVPEDLKLGQHNFKDFLEHKSKAIERSIANAKRQLYQQNRLIAELEKKKNPNYRLTVQNAVSQKEEELKNLTEPKRIANPLKSKTLRQQKDSVQGKIQKCESAISTLKRRIKKAKTERGRKNSLLENLSQFKRELEQYDKELRRFIADKRKLFKGIADIDVDQIFAYELKTDIIDGYIDKERELMEEFDFLLSQTSVLDKKKREQSLIVQLNSLDKSLERLHTRLDVPNRIYRNYLKAREAWKEKRSAIRGDKKTPGTLANLKETIKYIDSTLEPALGKARKKREDIVREIYRHKQEIIAIYSNIKEHISRTLKDNTEGIEDYPINIVGEFFIRPDFPDCLLGYINKTVSGNYRGVEEARAFLTAILDRHNVNDESDLIRMLNDIVESLEYESQSGEMITRFIDDQVQDMEEFYNYLFRLDYLAENYQLKLGDKSLETLSPGEKGALLLVFYLLLDKSDIPLILDQPEDNLDNQSVYQILVPFIKKAKKRRQILMITHNPNLAVVADAEQIIRVDIRKDEQNEFTWISGSIENPYIKKAIVDVLEGTMPAFQNRSHKYEQ